MAKVTISYPTQVGGKRREQGETVEVERAERNRLVYLGLARDVVETKPVPQAEGKVK